MKYCAFIVFCLFRVHAAFSAGSVADRKMPVIPDSETKSTSQIASYITRNYHSDEARVRAAFNWVIENICYDVNDAGRGYTTETEDEAVAYVMRSHQGNCYHYASVFSDICNKTGLKAYVILGYVKLHDKVSEDIGHAWDAVYISNAWYMFDPTWCSGYVSAGKFYHSINSNYFMVKPHDFLATHMPFDYLWQFTEHPVTNREFYNGTTTGRSLCSIFSFNDSIQAYEQQTELQRLLAAQRRSEAAVPDNIITEERLKCLNLSIQHCRSVITYNGITDEFNSGVADFNRYVDFRNNNFYPSRRDAEIRDMLKAAKNKISHALERLNAMDTEDEALMGQIRESKALAARTMNRIADEETWLDKYLNQPEAQVLGTK